MNTKQVGANLMKWVKPVSNQSCISKDHTADGCVRYEWIKKGITGHEKTDSCKRGTALKGNGNSTNLWCLP
jgi:hypothetical protein